MSADYEAADEWPPLVETLAQDITALALAKLYAGGADRDCPEYAAQVLSTAVVIALAASQGEPRALESVRKAHGLASVLAPDIPLDGPPEPPALPAITALEWNPDKQALTARPAPGHPAMQHLGASLWAYARAAYDSALAQQPAFTANAGAIEIRVTGSVDTGEAQGMPGAAEYALTLTIRPEAQDSGRKAS